MVNNVPGRVVDNIRQSLRQGDIPSMHFFSFGIDPLLTYLEKRLQGILISSLPVQDPVNEGQDRIKPVEERYKLIGYADDVKPAICRSSHWWTEPWSCLRRPLGANFIVTLPLRNASFYHWPGGRVPCNRKTSLALTCRYLII